MEVSRKVWHPNYMDKPVVWVRFRASPERAVELHNLMVDRYGKTSNYIIPNAESGERLFQRMGEGRTSLNMDLDLLTEEERAVLDIENNNFIYPDRETGEKKRCVFVAKKHSEPPEFWIGSA